jgi:C-terminal processing protease CtpA/Prc
VAGDLPIDYNVFFEKVGLTVGTSKIKTNFIMMNGAPIVSANPEQGTIFFTNAVLENSFWKAEGAQPKDVIKTINGEALTLLNANQLLQNVFQWTPGKAIEVVLDRDGQDIVIKTTTTQPYTKGQGLVEKEDATAAQIALRKAWINR